jgi:TolB-like protein
VFFYVVLNLLSIGCVSNRSASNADELDAAIREASNYLNENIPKGNKLAFLNFRSEYQTLSEYVIDELISNTINDKLFTVVDRANLSLIQQEIDFQMSGKISDEMAVSIGQMLGAQTIVSGAVSKMGDLFRLRVRTLDVQTAQILGQFNRNIPNYTTIALLTENPAITSGTAVPRTNTPIAQASRRKPLPHIKLATPARLAGLFFTIKATV